jgi:hypothetical protein
MTRSGRRRTCAAIPASPCRSPICRATRTGWLRPRAGSWKYARTRAAATWIRSRSSTRMRPSQPRPDRVCFVTAVEKAAKQFTASPTNRRDAPGATAVPARSPRAHRGGRG